MKQKLFFSFLYFSEGAPIGFVWWALPAILAAKGMSLGDIATLTALATLPWSFKFLMAPLIDILAIKGIALKWQLLFFQLMMGFSALQFIPLLDSLDIPQLRIFLFIHALCAASQDVCIDALAIKSIPEDDLGSANGFMQAGMLLGRSIFGGAGMFIANLLGISVFIYLLTTAIWMSLLTLFVFSKEKPPESTLSISKYMLDLKLLLLQKSTWKLFAIALLLGFSYEGLGGTASATLVKIGVPSFLRTTLYTFAVPILMGVGALLGGYLSDQRSKIFAVKTALFYTALMSLGVAFCFDFQPSPYLTVVAMGSFYFGIGLLTASLYAYLMGKTLKEFAAFQFSLLMAATNLCESLATYLTGQWYSLIGFSGITLFLVLSSFVGLALMQDRSQPA